MKQLATPKQHPSTSIHTAVTETLAHALASHETERDTAHTVHSALQQVSPLQRRTSNLHLFFFDHSCLSCCRRLHTYTDALSHDQEMYMHHPIMLQQISFTSASEDAAAKPTMIHLHATSYKVHMTKARCASSTEACGLLKEANA